MKRGQHYHKSKFTDFFSDLFSVLLKLDKHSNILSTEIPTLKEFHEPYIQDINYSFQKYLDALREKQNPKENGEAEDAEEPQDEDEKKDITVTIPAFKHSTTLLKKFDANQYHSVYQIYHDLKISCILNLLKHENDAPQYKHIDTFYKVSTELLLRETLRLGLTLQDNSKVTDQDNYEGDETSLESTLSRDFELISTTYFNKTGEALQVQAQNNLPLFTSRNSLKSELDDREPIIDVNLTGLNVMKIVPTISSANSEPLSNLSPKIPLSNQHHSKDFQSKHPSGAVLENYMHPIWIRLTTSQWLKHGVSNDDSHFSFAPTCDESRAIISNEWKSLTWLQQVGFKKLMEAKRLYNASISETKDVVTASTTTTLVNGTSTKENGEANGKTEKEAKDVEMKDAEPVDSTTADDDEQVDLENVLKWSVGHIIEKDEKEAIKSNSAQMEISKLLLELNELRKTRIQFQKQQMQIQSQLSQHNSSSSKHHSNNNSLSHHYKIIKASKQEVEKFHKLSRLVTSLIKNKDINPDQLNISRSSKIPVLQHNYAGSLPASFYGNSSSYGSSRSGLRSSKRRR